MYDALAPEIKKRICKYFQNPKLIKDLQLSFTKKIVRNNQFKDETQETFLFKNMKRISAKDPLIRYFQIDSRFQRSDIIESYKSRVNVI